VIEIRGMEEERLAEALETVQERAALSSTMNPAPRPDPDESEEPDTLTADDQVFIRDVGTGTVLVCPSGRGAPV
jgi:hypothetical protein